MRERAYECAHDKADEFMDTEGNDAVIMYLNKESRSISKHTIQRFRMRHGLSCVIGPVWPVGTGCYSQAALPMPLSKPLYNHILILRCANI